MASILKPFGALLNPGPYQVPGGPGQYTIDWTDPLANGLVACWLPGLGFSDLVAGLNLVPASAASFGGITVEGIGFSSQAANTGAGTTATLSGVFRGAGLASWTSFTIRWRGYVASTPQSFASFLAQTFDNAAGAPFAAAGLGTDNTGFYRVEWNNGLGHQSFNSSFAITVPSFIDVAATFVVNGTNTFYFNGKSDTTAAWGSATQAAASVTSVIQLNEDAANAATRWIGGICNIAQMWNRTLSAAEIQALYLSPYSLIVPAEYEEPVLFFPPTPPVFTLMPQIVM